MKSIIARAYVPALLLVCLLVWLAPASRTAGMHFALFVAWGLALLQYSRRYGLFAKTVPQVYQAYRHRAIQPSAETRLFSSSPPSRKWCGESCGEPRAEQTDLRVRFLLVN